MVGRRRLSPRTGVLLLLAVMLATSVVLWLVDDRRLPAVAASPRVPWWLLAPLFAVAEVVVLHVQIRREAQTISLNEIPLCLALFLARPADMLVGAVLGSGAVYVLYRRQTPLKSLFNVALRAFGVTLILTVAHLLGGSPSPQSPRAWLAAAGAAALAGAMDGLVVLAVVGIHDGTIHRRDVLRELVRYPPISAAVATIGVLATIVLHVDPRTAPLLVVVAVALFAGYRAHAALNHQHLGLARVYEVGRLVTATHDTEAIVRAVLAGARDLLRAEVAEIVLLATRTQPSTHRWIMSEASTPREESITAAHPAIWQRVVTDSAAVLLPRGTRADGTAAQLASLGYQEAIVVPLKDETGVIGTLMVADRMGEVRTFQPDDIPGLETIANQAALALANAHLLERLRHEAMHDVLTGLANRAKFKHAVDTALADLPPTESAERLAVLLLDLNGFKDINDSLGHLAGDRLLTHVADRLAGSLSPPALAARLGGDEFAVLLPGADPQLSESVAESIHHALAEPLTVDGIEVQAVTSIGIAIAPEHGRTTTDLLRAADAAMYAAKTGSGRTAVYTDTPAGAGPRRSHSPAAANTSLARVAELRKAVRNGEIGIEVQPQVRADSGDIIGVEALLRWHHPRFGSIPPREVLRLGERHGLTHDLTELVLDTALNAAASWQSRGIDVRMAVNLSGPSLLDPRLPGVVTAALERHGLAPSHLTLEITEESVVHHPDQTLTVLTALRDAGLRLSVDDFGTGYSSLTYLRRLPIHEVKIDESFIASIASRPEDLTITRGIIDLATNLALDTVAEGVEDQQTWDELIRLGCHTLQGHHLAEPMPIDHLPVWLRNYDQQRGHPPAIPHPRHPPGIATHPAARS